MITSMLTSLMRVTVFWYVLGLLVFCIGSPDWAESAYRRLAHLPGVPVIELHGLGTAATVQFHLLVYWTLPLIGVWLLTIGLGYAVIELRYRAGQKAVRANLKPTGTFWDVAVAHFSLGKLPQATTPPLTGARVAFSDQDNVAKGASIVTVQGAIAEAVKMLTPAERELCEQLLQLMLADPEHFAGLGHGVGLLEHTLNVVSEAASKCTTEFRLPLLAAFAHDVGKLVTFKPDGKGGWVRKGLHSRESARILATLPGFRKLPETHQRALLLAVKYDHAPAGMPELRGERDATQLALRIINALAQADRTATAAEKDRNLEKLQPEDLLWRDFVDFLREAPVVQRGKKGVSNQVNNPPDSPYLFIYEAPWRDAAVRRLPPEVAAALDLTRRDAGKVAKYTRILAERLRKEGLLVEQYKELEVSAANPLWDIQSGTGEKAVVLRGIFVLDADKLWKALNYRISIKSPFPVQILAPNADAEGKVSHAPAANRDEPYMPDVSDGLKLPDIVSQDAMASLGLSESPVVGEGAAQEVVAAARPRTRSRSQFKSAPNTTQDELYGLSDAPVKHPQPKATAVTQPELAVPDVAETDGLSADVEAWLAQQDPTSPPEEAESTNTALALFAGLAAEAETTLMSDMPAPVESESEPPAPEAEPAHSAPPETPAPELSRAEKREGLAIADEEALKKYPQLALGDKYYTEHSRAVQSGLKKPGGRYKGDSKERDLGLAEEGPRRGRRRMLSQ